MKRKPRVRKKQVAQGSGQRAKQPMYSSLNVAAISGMGGAASALAAAAGSSQLWPVLVAAVAGSAVAYGVTNEIPKNGE